MEDGIRRKVGVILGQAIPANGWEKTFQDLERQGRMDPTKVWKLLILILKELELHEQRNKLSSNPAS